MGTSIQRCSQLCDHPENQKFQYFVSKSQKQWVRKTQLKEAQKIVLIQKTQKQPEKSFFYKHDKADYVKGIVYSGGSFYQGPIDRTHCASGKGLQRFLTQVNTIDDCEGSYEGEFKENSRHGKGIYQDKFIKFQGEWNNGFPKKGTLERLLFGEKNSVIYRFDQIQFNNLQRTTGICSVVLPDGSEYKGQFVNKNTNQYVIEGRGILKFPNNQVYDGEFRDGKFHGNGIYYSFNNQKYEGQYKNGLKNGSGKLYLNKNCYVSGQWINGKKSGKFQLFMITVNGDKSKLKQFQFEKIEDLKQKIPKKSK